MSRVSASICIWSTVWRGGNRLARAARAAPSIHLRTVRGRVRRLANALKPRASAREAPSAPLPARTGTSRLTSASGTGMVLHTCNPRLHPAQLIYIVNHAEDRVMFFDLGFALLIEELAPQCPRVSACYPSVRGGGHALDPGSPERLVLRTIHRRLRRTMRLAAFLIKRSAAALCYTSGTTAIRAALCIRIGRSASMPSPAACPVCLALRARDDFGSDADVPRQRLVTLAAPIAGAKLVLPGQVLGRRPSV